MAGGIDDIVPHIEIDGAEATEVLRNIGIVGAEAFSKIIEAASHGDFTGLATMIGGELAGSFTKVTQEALHFVEAQASAAETLSNLAEATGSTLTEIIGLKDAFASVGIEASGFERAIGRLAITIARDWASIEEAVRTSGDAQASAITEVQQAALNLEKAYAAVGDGATQSAQTQVRDSLAVESAAFALKKTLEDMASGERGRQEANRATDFALSQKKGYDEIADSVKSLSREIADSALSYTTGLRSIQEARDAVNGVQLSSAQQKARKLRDLDEQEDALNRKRQRELQDQAEKEEKIKERKADLERKAQREAEENNKKQATNAREREQQVLTEQKEQEALASAQAKKIEDGIKADEAEKQARLNVAKAQQAQRADAEKLYESGLKDVPKIAQELEQVAAKTKTWDDVMNHAEISAQTLGRSIILAAKGGVQGGGPPPVEAVFKEMSSLFEGMGHSADAMSKKLEIVQNLMSSGFRSGQASAAQTLAILERGPAALTAFNEAAKKFSETPPDAKTGASRNIGISKEDAETLKNFNSAFAQLDGIIDSVKGHFAALLAAPLTKFFDEAKESILNEGSALNTLIRVFQDLLNAIMGVANMVGTAISKIVEAFNMLVNAIASLTGLKPETVFEAMTAGAVLFSGAILRAVEAVVAMAAKMVLWVAIIGIVTTAVGLLTQGVAKLMSLFGAGQEVEKFGQKLEALGQIMTRSAAKTMGATDADLSKGIGPAFFGKAPEEKKSSSGEAKVGIGPGADDLKKAAGDTTKAASKTEGAAEKTDKVVSRWDIILGKYDDALFKKKPEAEKPIKPEDDTRGSSDGTGGFGNKARDAATKLDKAAEVQTNAAEKLAVAGPGLADAGTKLADAGSNLSAAATKMQAALTAAPGSSNSNKAWQGGYIVGGAARRGFADGGSVGKSGSGGGGSDDKAASALTQAAKDLEQAVDTLYRGFSEVLQAFNKEVSKLGEAANRLQNVTYALNGSAQALTAAAEALTSAATAIAGLGSHVGGGKAGGGMIFGPGGPTDDNAGLFALSDGEYVVRSAAVSHYGPALFDSLNNLSLGGFAAGGAVHVSGARAPSLPGGPTGGPQSTLNLTIDGNHFNGLKAPDAVASKLKSYAVSRQASSAQKLPTWAR